MTNTLAEKLHTLRDSKGLTLRQLSEETGISNPYLSQLETGKIPNPGILTIRTLAAFYQVQVEWLIRE